MGSIIRLLKISAYPLFLFLVVLTVLAILGKYDWIIVLIIFVILVILILFTFLLDRKQMKQNITRIGGMEKIYTVFRENIYTSFQNVEILKVDADSLNLIWETDTSTNYLGIIETPSGPTVKWQENSQFKINKGSWDLKVNFDQDVESKKIIREIQSYKKSKY